MRITNAGEASYPRAWQGYNACASYDRKYWFRIATSYDAKAGVLEITHKPTRVRKVGGWGASMYETWCCSCQMGTQHASQDHEAYFARLLLG